MTQVQSKVSNHNPTATLQKLEFGENWDFSMLLGNSMLYLFTGDCTLKAITLQSLNALLCLSQVAADGVLHVLIADAPEASQGRA